VSWDRATDPDGVVVAYRVYRSAVAGGQDFMTAHAVVSGTSFTEAVGWDETWHYVVRARDSRGAEDGNAVEVVATGADGTPPQVTLLAAPGGGCTVSLTFDAFDACSGGPRATELHRSTDPLFAPSPATLVATSPTSPWIDLAPANGFHFYRVIVEDRSGNVSTSALASARVAECMGAIPPPGEPRLHVAVDGGDLVVAIEPADGADHHRLYRGTLNALRAGAADHAASVGIDRIVGTTDDIGRCRFDGVSTTDALGVAPDALFWLVTGIDAGGREGSLGRDSLGRERPPGTVDCP